MTTSIAGNSAPEPASAQISEIPRLRDERDRFVAFAFCSADILIELGDDGGITFAAGMLMALLGIKPGQVRGRALIELMVPSSRAVLQELLTEIAAGRRVEPVVVRFAGADGPTSPMYVVGYRVPELPNRTFLVFRMARAVAAPTPGARSRLPDADAFAARALALAKSQDGDEGQLTIFELEQLSLLQGRLDATGRVELDQAIAGSLRAGAIDGQAASDLGNGRFGLVHDEHVDLDALRSTIEERTRALDPTGIGVAVTSASLELASIGVEGPDVAQALAYTMRSICDSDDALATIDTLSDRLPAMLDETGRRIARFRRMIDGDGFALHYQPIVELRSRRTSHFEVLSRFHDDGGSASSFELISFAEELNLIPTFDLEVCRRALETLETGAADGRAWPLAVNLSGRSVETADFRENLLALLAEHQAVRRHLMFEVTESMAMSDLADASEFLQVLRGAGSKVALDDFGVGAAAFEYLRSIEIDLVKIDGSYVRNALANPKNGHFLRAIAGLCRDLGVATVGEMVEDEACARFLADVGVAFGQGYLFGRPEPQMRPTIPSAPVTAMVSHGT